MEFKTKKKKSTIINITSLIDVLFLLLIFMMVSSTFIEDPGIKLDLPETQSAPSVKKSEYILSVKSDGSLFLNEKSLSLDELAENLKSTLAEMKDESLILKGDTNIPYGQIVKIMDIVKKSGVRKLIIATRQGTPGKKVP
ncbi:MAG: biopolymer transporter ExbD [Candidatus Aminicenantes bacterium]|nr:biopolymer transporter ExbD [Candidatus Aminicenantes bacterium]